MSPPDQQGFSLIEMMITVAILSVLIMLGVPSYQQWVRDTRIRTASESIQNGLRIARSEAAQRGAKVRFELLTTTTAEWTVCAISSTDTTTNPTCGDAATTIQRYVSGAGAANVVVNGTTTAGDLAAPLVNGVPANSGVTFNSLGRPTGYGSTSLARIDVTAGQPTDRWLVTTISSGGMVRMCDPQLQQSVSPQGCIP